MKSIRQKRKTTNTAPPYMIEDIIDTNKVIKQKLREATCFYELMKCTPADFLRGSTTTEDDALVVSADISQKFFKIQSSNASTMIVI